MTDRVARAAALQSATSTSRPDGAATSSAASAGDTGGNSTAADATTPHWSWYFLPRPHESGANQITLLRGGAELFAAMCEAIAAARHEVWVATYIFHTDNAGLSLVAALCAAARRGVAVHVVIDGFGSIHSVDLLSSLLQPAGVQLTVFRPLRRLAHWLNPSQLRRQHMKLCGVDWHTGFVGGINLIDDHVDLRHGSSDQPRLDYAARVRGPAARAVGQAARAVWSRAFVGGQWRAEVSRLLQGNAADETAEPGAAQPTARPAGPPEGRPAGPSVGGPDAETTAAHTTGFSRQRLAWLRRQVRQLRKVLGRGKRRDADPMRPMRATFIVRDNLRQRRSIERAYVEAIRASRERIVLVCPYFYPGGEFRRALCDAARRGVSVRLLLQGKLDYRLAGLAARALYDELLSAGVEIFEYMPAFLHAKVAVVDDNWATVGSSNIDPLSLLLNLEANLIVRDPSFCAELARLIEADITLSLRVAEPAARGHGWRGWAGLASRALVAWVAHVYLRVAGVTGRY
ncbi:MAG: cardiolipin synthase ClsB [Burkholderiales bacterium]|nr:cardiolipin synthase ClsB [Burkholderiales bacterium]